MKIPKWLKTILNLKEEAPDYPGDFLIVDFSPIAKQYGYTTEQNKVIYRYFFDVFGNRIMKKYPYSKARLFALKEVHHLPVMDKTIKEDKFPVFGKVLPSEIQYTR